MRFRSAHTRRLVGRRADLSKRRRQDDDGFTILEVIVAFTILAIVGLAIVGGLATGTRYTAVTSERVQANNIARQYLESARAVGQSAGTTLTPVVVNDTQYKVCRIVSPVGAAGTPQPVGPDTSCPTGSGTGCGSGGSSSGLSFYVTVTVRWQTPLGSDSVRADTVIAC